MAAVVLICWVKVSNIVEVGPITYVIFTYTRINETDILTKQEMFCHSSSDSADCCACCCRPAFILLLSQVWPSSNLPAKDLFTPGQTHGHSRIQTAWAPDWSKFIMAISYHHHHHHSACQSVLVVSVTSSHNCTGSFLQSSIALCK